MSFEIITFVFMAERIKTMLLTKKQQIILTKLQQGYELRINIANKTFTPVLIKDDEKEIVAMKSITAMRAKQFIRDSDKYQPPYHFYILTEKGKNYHLK